MRPTWKAATIVEPSENVSGSTSVRWLVVLDALHVACVNGSVLTMFVAARAAPAKVSVPNTPTASAAALRRRRPPSRFDVWEAKVP